VPPNFRAPGGDATAIDAELDQLNTNIMNLVQRGGRAYLSSATLRGKFALRACITNFRTTRADIDQTLDIIREAARTLEKS
jgi:aromatic-L-amino-acid decarboxylase